MEACLPVLPPTAIKLFANMLRRVEVLGEQFSVHEGRIFRNLIPDYKKINRIGDLSMASQGDPV